MTLRRYIRTKFSALVYGLVIDSKPQPDDSFFTYGHQIDDIVIKLLSPLSSNAVGYKIEDNGILVGCYVVDWDAVTKLPHVAIELIRSAYSDTDRIIISNQINTWLQTEYPLVY